VGSEQLIAALLRRTQPWETALPSVPPTFASPCMAIWPEPPSNCCRTLERALNASAYGAPTAPGRNRMDSSTKNLPSGVGVEVFPRSL